jgi:hypothetical protein
MTSDLQHATEKVTAHGAIWVFRLTICSGILIALTMVTGAIRHDLILSAYLALNIVLCVISNGERGHVFTRIGTAKLALLGFMVLLQVTLFLLGKRTIAYFFVVFPVGLVDGWMWIAWGRSRSKHEIDPVLSEESTYRDDDPAAIADNIDLV